MNNEYIALFEDIDETIDKTFHDIFIDIKIIGYVSLVMAGLPDLLGTKDVDALGVGVLENQNNEIVGFLSAEFGKGSPAARRHGLYLDIVSKAIVWLPPNARFINIRKLKCINLFRMHPVDTCVSKVFSNFQREPGRGRDKDDILKALDNNIVTFSELVLRLDESLPRFESQAPAPEVFPRVISFVNALQAIYGPHPLAYRIPNWMENM